MSSAPLVRASMVRWSMVGFSGCSGLGGTGGVSILTMSGSVLGVGLPGEVLQVIQVLVVVLLCVHSLLRTHQTAVRQPNHPRPAGLRHVTS